MAKELELAKLARQARTEWITSLTKEKLNCLVSSLSAWVRAGLMFVKTFLTSKVLWRISCRSSAETAYLGFTAATGGAAPPQQPRRY